MMNSVLLSIGASEASRAAQVVAFDLVVRRQARLSGIDIIDLDRLVSHEPAPIGGIQLKAQAESSRLAAAAVRWEAQRKRFGADAKEAGIAADVIMARGDAHRELLRVAQGHDLIILGQDAVRDDDEATLLLSELTALLQRNPRPVLVCPATARPISKIMVAYDGSQAAARALQLFVLLGLGALGPVEVLSVAADQGEAEIANAAARDYLAGHGIAAASQVIATTRHPAAIIAACDPAFDLIVLGAYGNRGWRDRLFGSSTTRILENLPTSLFIHH